MQKYQSYKHSGIQWLGEIPEHWNVVRSKYLLKIQTDSSKRSNKIGLENIESHTGKYLPSNSVFEGDGVDFDKGDIVYGKLRPYLCKVWIAEFEGNAVGDFYVYKTSKDYYNGYAKYFMMSNLFTDICNASTYGARMPRVSSQFIQSLLCPLPPLTEQRAIVSYLDYKCAKIDRLLEGKAKQIALLGEMKQRLIADAVTHGLNPDVKMKESGVYWIPNTPKNWEIIKLGYILKKENRERPQNAELLVCTNKATVIKRGESKMGLVAESDEVYQGVKKGDLLIHGMDTWHGAIAISNYDGMCTPVVHVCTSDEDVEYISLYLRYMAMMKVFKLISNGVRQNTSDFRSWPKVAAIPCPVPPLSEQRAIVAYINERVAKIDTLAAKLQKEIDNIKEYKQRLISNVVTGQVKVS